MRRAKFAVVGDRLDVMALSLRNKVEMLFFGRTKLGEVAMSESWRGKVPFYAFKCSKHGVVANYFHGYSQSLFCPVCNDSQNLQTTRFSFKRLSAS